MENRENNPLVSVVMGCYNNEKYIKESIDSILRQTISNIELIIVDDCSKDNTTNIIESFQDPRIILIRNDENHGLGYNLHLGVSRSKGKYIARMDADDIASPIRFEQQINYLNNNPDVLCIGTSYTLIGDLSFREKYIGRHINQAYSNEMLKVRLLLGTPMLHPSVMFNATILRANNINYNPAFRTAQDYELWSRVFFDYKIANLKQKLMFYRVSNQQVSNKKRDDQIQRSRVIYNNILTKALCRNITEEEIDAHILLATKVCQNEAELHTTSRWLSTLFSEISKCNVINTDCFVDFMSLRWAVICSQSLPYSQRWKYYGTVPFSKSKAYGNIVRLFAF